MQLMLMPSKVEDSSASTVDGLRTKVFRRCKKRLLLYRHRSGDKNAFAELVNQYRLPVYTYLMRCGIDSTSCDDLFQDIFLKVHLYSSSYNPFRPLDPWIFKIVINSVRSYCSKNKDHELVVEEHPPNETDTLNALSTLLNREDAEWLEQAVNKLPENQREVIRLHFMKDFSQKDIAEILGIPVNTVKTAVRRARITLAKARIARDAKLKSEVS